MWMVDGFCVLERRSVTMPLPRREPAWHDLGVANKLIDLVKAMDRCWVERRYDDLASYIAEDIIMVAPGGQARLEGLRSAIDSYREFMSRSDVRRYETSGYTVTERGVAAVVEYAWEMAWDSQGVSNEASGREVLALARRDGAWRVFWRMQLPG